MLPMLQDSSGRHSLITDEKYSDMIKEPYNQYIPYTDVVYCLVGYDIYYPETEMYPRFAVHKTLESLHRTLEDAEVKIKEAPA